MSQRALHTFYFECWSLIVSTEASLDERRKVAMLLPRISRQIDEMPVSLVELLEAQDGVISALEDGQYAWELHGASRIVYEIRRKRFYGELGRLEEAGDLRLDQLTSAGPEADG
ncbi:MAG: hypothetical protein AAFU34_15630 [Pseudomonadota bacterium]